jgi:hypothetical protein
MGSSRTGRSRPFVGRRWALWTALSVGWLLPSVGCQVEYAGMTLPSGKYMYDDVQYFQPGPDFPWSNTQAATQRARMQAMGIETGPLPGPQGVPTAAGALPAVQGRMGRPTDVNASPLSNLPPIGPGGGPAPNVPAPPVPAPGVPAAPGIPAPPGGAAPAPASLPRRRPIRRASKPRCDSGSMPQPRLLTDV